MTYCSEPWYISIPLPPAGTWLWWQITSFVKGIGLSPNGVSMIADCDGKPTSLPIPWQISYNASLNAVAVQWFLPAGLVCHPIEACLAADLGWQIIPPVSEIEPPPQWRFHASFIWVANQFHCQRSCCHPKSATIQVSWGWQINFSCRENWFAIHWGSHVSLIAVANNSLARRIELPPECVLYVSVIVMANPIPLPGSLNQIPCRGNWDCHPKSTATQVDLGWQIQ